MRFMSVFFCAIYVVGFGHSEEEEDFLKYNTSTMPTNFSNPARFGVQEDGQCFVSCIRLFFREYLPTMPDQTIAMLHDKFTRLNLKQAFFFNGAISSAQLDEQSDAFFKHTMTSYGFFEC